jgi:hypothetical protein
MKSIYSPEQAYSLFNARSEKWWIAGGWALDLFLDTQIREHEDLDIAILRQDERVFRAHLQDWEIWPGLGKGILEGNPIKHYEELSKELGAMWCRSSRDAEWAFELLLNEFENDEWVFKRDPNVRKPFEELNLTTVKGIPYLNPEIVLLFKAKNMLDKDQQDFEQVGPKLSQEAREWLGGAIRIVHPNHQWLEEL